jgi:hypothetical protein
MVLRSLVRCADFLPELGWRHALLRVRHELEAALVARDEAVFLRRVSAQSFSTQRSRTQCQ